MPSLFKLVLRFNQSNESGFQVEVRLSTRSNNEWKRNAFVLKFEKACSSAMNHAKFLIDLWFEPHERRCPTPAVRPSFSASLTPSSYSAWLIFQSEQKCSWVWCWFQIGLRHMRNKTVNPVFPHFPILPYGRYLFTLAVMDRKQDVVGLIVIDGNAIPKL